MTVKLLVIYPPPVNPTEFDRRYREEHIPLGMEKLVGATKLVTNQVLGAPAGKPAFHLVTEVHFPSLEVLQACAATPGAAETMAHAASLSTGGAPQFVITHEG